MKTFHCTHCQNLVFFENDRCLQCECSLAYLADAGMMVALERGSDNLWRSEAPAASGRAYRLCANYIDYNVCNWAVPIAETDEFCLSCRLTRVIPNLAESGNQEAWYKLETAKRRLVYTLLNLRLPLAKKEVDTDGGLAFEFLKDSIEPNGDKNRVMTGHDNGLITINVAEADDVQREKQRQQQNEPYRTLLGHFRHEIGHYYWDRLVQDSPRLVEFRELFGDERADYSQALQRHYESGPPSTWENEFISAYATMHPWEDWAESWAHFLHMIDALETAGSIGMSLQPRRSDEPSMSRPVDTQLSRVNFEQMIEQWSALTYGLNNLSRGLGLPDSYPFVLSPRVIEKLRFISDTIVQASKGEILRNQPKGPSALTLPRAAQPIH